MNRLPLAALLSLALAACVATGAPPQPAGLLGDRSGLQPAGTPLRIDFGRAEAGTVAAVSRLLGANPVSADVLAECGAGPVKAVSWANGLTLNFQRGAFLGWVSDDGRGTPVAASAGFGPGTPRAALTGASFRETSLGTEFEQGGVFGLLEGDRVDIAWAGLTCFFR